MNRQFKISISFLLIISIFSGYILSPVMHYCHVCDSKEVQFAIQAYLQVEDECCSHETNDICSIDNGERNHSFSHCSHCNLDPLKIVFFGGFDKLSIHQIALYFISFVFANNAEYDSGIVYKDFCSSPIQSIRAFLPYLCVFRL